MIYKRDRGPHALALWADPTVRIFLGVVTVGALFVFWHEWEPMLTFRPVDAEVVGSDVAQVRLTGRYGSFRRYEPEVFYRYVVAGTPYMGRKYSRTDLESSPSVALQRADANAGGNKVRAWYNPLRPDEAVLSREPNTPVLVLTCFILLTAWLGASRKMLRAEPPPPPGPAAAPIG